MIKRCVEISSGPAHLAVRHGQLLLKREGETIGQVPIEDLGVLIADHPAITYTHGALDTLLAHNVAVVLCGQDHHPAGMLLPFEGNTFQARAVQAQAAATDTVKKRLWKEIVKAKVTAQGDFLESIQLEVGAFRDLARSVKAGDPENIEAQAAQRYWRLAFDESFRRNRNGPPPNNLLNYGYMVLRAAAARATVGAGLHPSLGIHHRNQYNAFALADDLMEPFRPLVDSCVRRFWEKGERELTPEIKKDLIGITARSVQWKEEKSPLLVALVRVAASLRSALAGEAETLELPGFLPEEA